MATLASYVKFCVQPNGNDLNGGAFEPSYSSTGTDASEDDDPIVTIDGSSVTATKNGGTELIVTGHTVAASEIGNCLWGQLNDSASSWVQSGPISYVNTSLNKWGWASDQPWDWYTTTGFTSARLGGALATPGGLGDPTHPTTGRLGNHSICYIKAATYTRTASDAESGGRVHLGKYGPALIAYKTTPGDHGDYPDDRVIIDTGSTANDSNGVVYFSNDSAQNNAVGIEVRGNDTWARGFGGIHTNAHNCVAKNFTDYGYYFSAISLSTSSRAESCGSGSSNHCGFFQGGMSECIAIDCDPNGFYNYEGATRCVTHGGTYGFYQPSEITEAAVACVADGASNTGFWTNQAGARARDCVAINCAVGVSEIMDGGGNAFYNNTANFSATSGLTHVNETQLTADPFTDAPNYDYTLNDTAGGGAELATRHPKFGAGVSEGGPQQQMSAQLKSTGGGSSVIPAYPHQSGT